MTNLSVQAIHFRNGQSLTFNAGEIVLVVGRNSSGKSTFLREIATCLSNHESPRKIINKTSFRASSPRELESRVYNYFRVTNDGGMKYVKNDRGHVEFHLPEFNGGPDKLSIGKASKAFVTLLNAEGRLSLTHDVDTIDIYLSKPQHPFHVFMTDPEILKRTSVIAKQAFGVEITINRIGNPIRGYVAETFGTEDRLSAEKSLPERAELLVSQGDGLRSFVGIVGEIEAMNHPVVLIDEPEAFLHPPQAKRLGRNIVSSLDEDRQAFIATHNSNFLQGVIAKLTERIRVVRLERAEGTFRVVDISHAHLKQAEALPAVANTNLLDSLFYDQTIVCEADADAKLFEKLVPDEEQDRFWFSAGGKQQFQKVARLLTSFGVDWRVVLDLDALLDWPILQELAALKGIDISSQKKRVAAALKAMKPIDLAAVRAAAVSALSKTADDDAAIRDCLRELDARKTSTPLKQYGLSAVPKGQERQVVQALLDELSAAGILLLRKGELESYVPTVGGHGPHWVNAVILEAQRFDTELADLRTELERIAT